MCGKVVVLVGIMTFWIPRKMSSFLTSRKTIKFLSDILLHEKWRDLLHTEITLLGPLKPGFSSVNVKFFRGTDIFQLMK